MKALFRICSRLKSWFDSRSLWRKNRRKFRGNQDGRNLYYCRCDRSGMWCTLPPILAKRKSYSDYSAWDRHPAGAVPLLEEEIWENKKEDPETWKFVRIFTINDFSAWKKQAVLEAVFTDL